MIYIDMDGVLVKPQGEDFAKRPWFPQGRILWGRLAHFSPTLLSWGRTGAEFERISKEKREWVDREMGKHVPLIVLPDTPKAEVCKADDILIDDGLKHKEPWEKAGGIFVHFTGDIDEMVMTCLAALTK